MVDSPLLQGVLAAVLLAAAVRVLAKVRQWWRFYSTLAAIPTPQGGRGHVPPLCSARHHRTLQRWAKESGPVYVLRLYWEWTVVVTDPALITTLLKHSPDGDKPDLYQTVDQLGSAKGFPSLFSASSHSPHWKLVRKGIAPAFQPRNLRAGFPQIVAAAQEVVGILRSHQGQALDIDQLLLRESLDVIGRVGFGIDMRALQGFMQPGGDVQSGIFHHLTLALDEVNRQWGDPLRGHLWFLPGVREGRRHAAAFRRHMQDLLRALRAKGPPADSDVSIADHLLRLRDPDSGEPLSDERLLPEIAALFIAGHDTTAHTVAFTLYLLATHPEAEARVCEELAALGLLATPGSPAPRPVEYEDLAKLSYLAACIKESMRLLPVGADSTTRVFPRDLEVAGYRIPAGTMIWMPLFVTQTSERYWADAERYIPERWLEPGTEYCPAASAAAAAAAPKADAGPGPDSSSSSSSSRDPSSGAEPSQEQQLLIGGGSSRGFGGGGGSGSSGKGGAAAGRSPPAAAAAAAAPTPPLRFFPFGQGARDCVGQSLAKLNYTATLATLLGQLSFRLAPEVSGPGGMVDIIRLTLQPEGGLRVIATPRA